LSNHEQKVSPTPASVHPSTLRQAQGSGRTETVVGKRDVLYLKFA
jgi:hypothetical protein